MRRLLNGTREAGSSAAGGWWAVGGFKRMTGYPKGRLGCVVDQIVPLTRGGADTPANMQCQTI